MRAWRTGGVVNAIVAVAICAAVALVALPARQTAPLTVAELAPRAVQTQVDGAEQTRDQRRTPEEQAEDGERRSRRASADGDGDGDADGAGDGSGTGGGVDRDRTGDDDGDGAGPADEDAGGPQGEEPGSGPTDTTGDDAPERAPARRRRCVGSPPRQTEDPQSPPCVASSPYDASNNGGATSQGVTADEVRIALPVGAKFASSLEGHFNTRYELHGRRLRILPAPMQTATQQTGGTVDEAIANAVKVDEDLKAFASGFYITGGAERFYYDELARRGVISVHDRANSEGASALTSKAPYRWSVLPALDEASALQAAYVCRGLAGRPPQHGRLAERTDSDRVFGLAYSLQRDGAEPDLGDLRERLAACGATPAVTVALPADRNQAASRQAITKLRAARVTTVVQATNEYAEVGLLEAATSQAYFPEWLFSTVNDPDDSDAVFYDLLQLPGRFGTTATDAQLPLQQEPAYQAITEGDPQNAATFDPIQDRLVLEIAYRSTLLLASGIQAAGPNLTPETFAAGLQASRFPNPASTQAAWSFGPGDVTAVGDVTLGWIDQTTRSYETNGPGAVCYAQGGRRYTAAAMPDGDGGVRARSCR